MDIKQPELGKKISELRKAKGLTQEELVEKCNLNVRTIQRIEAGEVTPRSYTVKALFEALDFKWEEVRTEFAEREKKTPPQLYLAFAAGLLYFFLAFFEIGMEYEWVETGIPSNKGAFVLIKTLTFLGYVGFLLGLLRINFHFPNKLQKIALWVMIGFNVILYAVDMISLFSSLLTIQDYYWVKLQAYGLGYAFLGASYFAYSKIEHGIAQVVGALGLIAGLLIFSGVGTLFGLIPLTFFEIGQLGLMIYFIQKIGSRDAPEVLLGTTQT